MPAHTRRNAAESDAIGIAALSVKQFCKAFGISEAMFFKMRAQGLGPRVMKIGTRTLISKQAIEHWRAEVEAASAIDPAE